MEKPCKALQKEDLVRTVKHGGGGVMVWGCMVSNGVDNSFVNPTPLAHADTPRDTLPRGGYHSTYYTAGQLLRSDNTIIHINHKMKGSKMWKIRISAGY
ncbi:hypothetical protein TNCV_1285321 [Trichonephila clavipes]|uniref:Uncharacterized protein n=1 Tax=Trichonephila clavipes TaxID=2585209 RepID=A0A8X6SLC8_TRICX|nr:hypothetical protein TNCV_1285321 [Trichonephila clavipes]